MNPDRNPGRPSEENGVTSVLSPRHKQVILLGAQGYTREQTARILSISDHTVKTHRKAATSRLGAKQLGTATMIALRRGEIFPEEVLGDLDRDLLNQLHPAAKRVLRALSQEGRTDASNQKLAEDLLLSEAGVKSQLINIAEVIGSSHRERITAVAVAIELENQCLLSLASIVTPDDLKKFLEGKNERILRDLQKRLDTQTLLQTTIVGIKQKRINQEILTNNCEDKLQELSPEDITLLDRFIAQDGQHSTYQEIADEYNTTYQDIIDRVKAIQAKLDTSYHPAVIHYVLKQKNQVN